MPGIMKPYVGTVEVKECYLGTKKVDTGILNSFVGCAGGFIPPPIPPTAKFGMYVESDSPPEFEDHRGAATITVQHLTGDKYVVYTIEYPTNIRVKPSPASKDIKKMTMFLSPNTNSIAGLCMGMLQTTALTEVVFTGGVEWKPNDRLTGTFAGTTALKKIDWGPNASKFRPNDLTSAFKSSGIDHVVFGDVDITNVGIWFSTFDSMPNLVCVDKIYTLNASNTDAIFLDTPKLVHPTKDEQNFLDRGGSLQSPGMDWHNTNPCP